MLLTGVLQKNSDAIVQIVFRALFQESLEHLGALKHEISSSSQHQNLVRRVLRLQ